MKTRFLYENTRLNLRLKRNVVRCWRGLRLLPLEVQDGISTRGTTVEFELDEEVFGDQVVNPGLLRAYVRRLSFLFPGLTVCFQEEVFTSTKGLADLIRTKMGIESEPDINTAMKVAQRRGKPIVLTILARKMHQSGHAFYLSANGVWLTGTVPVAFIEFPKQS